MAQQPVSLEKPVGEEQDSALADLIEDVGSESPFEIASEALAGRTSPACSPACPRASAV